MPESPADIPQHVREAFRPGAKPDEINFWMPWICWEFGPDGDEVGNTWWWGYCPMHQPDALKLAPNLGCEAQYNVWQGSWRCKPAEGEVCHPHKNGTDGPRKKAGTMRVLKEHIQRGAK